MDIVEKVEMVKNHDVTALENLEGFLKTVEARNEDINAFIEINTDEAIRRAEEIDSRIKRGRRQEGLRDSL